MATPTIGLESLPWEYDVFLSFRGEDTRKTFTGHLYTALRHATINTFIDDEELKRGEYLAPAFTRAIQSSRISMIIFSKNYASSKWCLEELVQILECKEKGKQLVYPIFYYVDPTEVRNQRDVYGLALAEHEKKIDGKDKIQKWKDVLTKVGNMSGWNLQGIANGYEAKFIGEIINEVKSVVKRVPMLVSNHVVGIESQVEHVVRSMWGEQDNSVRMIGIYGVGGMGKTTLAQVLYNKFFEYFERSCFLEISSDDTKIRILQERFLSVLLNRKDIKVNSEGEGMMFIKIWLQTKKCLVVLDNLEDRDQFKALCGERYWFGAGSRIILTTRDAQLLNELEKGERYEIKALDHKRSLQLFSHHAFKGCFLSKEDYIKILDDMVVYCEGMPLALEVIGASLCNESKEKWMNTFEKLKKIPNKKVLAKLKISFDGLPDDNIKSLFLDLVCLSDRVSMKTIDSLGYFSLNEIQGLVDKCLIKDHGYHISMHKLIREMGREIIRLESPKNPGERSRLWCPADIHGVLKGQHKGTKKIEMIVLNSPMKNMEYKYNTKAFKDMKNLRFLQIDGIRLQGSFKHLPRKTLRCLQWDECPLKYIPSSYFFEKLVKLKMQNSSIKEFGAPLKYFQCLESLDLGRCKHLTRTPDFSGAKNLHTLSFLGCSRLEKVHSSIGNLRMLVELNLGGCTRLKKLPKKFWHWQLRSIEDPSSSKIKELDENSGMLTSLRSLTLDETNIQSLPSNTSHLLKPLKSILNSRRSFFPNDHLKLIQQFPPNLEFISLMDCKNLKVVSATLPTCLKTIFLMGCTNLKMLPKLSHTDVVYIPLRSSHNLEVVSATLPTCLEQIFMYDCTKIKILRELPHTLKTLWLHNCKNLKMLPKLPQNLLSLIVFNCESLETVHLSKMLDNLNLIDCKKLKEIQGWENAQFLKRINLRGDPNIKFSEFVNQVLKVSKLLFQKNVFKLTNIEFDGSLPINETLSWIKFEENGSSSSSIRFQPPPLISNLEFLGICMWMARQPQLPLETSYCSKRYRYHYSIATQSCAFTVWHSLLHVSYYIRDDGEAGYVVSSVEFIPGIVTAGEIFKVKLELELEEYSEKYIEYLPIKLSNFKDVKTGMGNKIRVEALYRDKEDGSVQFLPLSKLDYSTKQEEEELEFRRAFLQSFRLAY